MLPSIDDYCTIIDVLSRVTTDKDRNYYHAKENFSLIGVGEVQKVIKVGTERERTELNSLLSRPSAHFNGAEPVLTKSQSE